MATQGSPETGACSFYSSLFYHAYQKPTMKERPENLRKETNGPTSNDEDKNKTVHATPVAIRSPSSTATTHV